MNLVETARKAKEDRRHFCRESEPDKVFAWAWDEVWTRHMSANPAIAHGFTEIAHFTFVDLLADDWEIIR